MKIFGLVLLILVLVGLVFYILPAVTVFLVLFVGKRGKELRGSVMENTQYEPYREILERDFAFFDGKAFRDVTVKASDGKILHGACYTAGNRKLAILFHGFRATPMNNFAVLGRYLFEEKGFDLLFVDNRATGQSEGKLTGLGIKEAFDVRTWVRYASGLKDIDEILLSGVSMGATSIAFTADRLPGEKVKGVIMDCGFVCPRDQLLHMGENYKPLPGKILLPVIQFLARLTLHEDLSETTLRHLKKMTVPALFLHGEDDRMVPVEVGKQAYAACGASKQWCAVPGADHAVAFYADQRGKKAVSTFIDACFK